MRCIFCKQDSSSSVSKEHIVPESLGNRKNVLPPGVVCDRCNNYFASKVEGPVLSSPAFRNLRFEQAVRSKKNRFPVIDGMILPDLPVRMYRSHRDGRPFGAMEPRAFAHLLAATDKNLIAVFSKDMPADDVFSRFLAKCALETLVQRFMPAPGAVDMVVDESQLDEIREHARYGRPRSWKFLTRPIYDADRRVRVGDNDEQVLYEYDLFFTHPENRTDDGGIRSELYFLLCIFGVEFAINLGGSETTGYETWLQANGNVSPLYLGKNASVIP